MWLISIRMLTFINPEKVERLLTGMILLVSTTTKWDEGNFKEMVNACSVTALTIANIDSYSGAW